MMFVGKVIDGIQLIWKQTFSKQSDTIQNNNNNLSALDKHINLKAKQENVIHINTYAKPALQQLSNYYEKRFL